MTSAGLLKVLSSGGVCYHARALLCKQHCLVTIPACASLRRAEGQQLQDAQQCLLGCLHVLLAANSNSPAGVEADLLSLLQISTCSWGLDQSRQSILLNHCSSCAWHANLTTTALAGGYKSRVRLQVRQLVKCRGRMDDWVQGLGGPAGQAAQQAGRHCLLP